MNGYYHYGLRMLCRDDEHRTGLMLAAAEGHIPVMKILLDNLAAVNDGDKMKVWGKRSSLVTGCRLKKP